MQHNIRRLCNDVHIATARVLLPGKIVEKRLPIAEKAYDLTRKDSEKTAAHAAALFVPIPEEKLNSVVNLLWANARYLPDAQKHIVRVMELLKEHRRITELDFTPVTQLLDMRCYEDELLKGSISPATIAMRAAELSQAPQEIDSRKLLYVYSSLTELMDKELGQSFRETAVHSLYHGQSTKLTRELAVSNALFQQVCARIEKLGKGIAGANVDARVKGAGSATMKLVRKGYVNDLVGVRIICKNAQEAVENGNRLKTAFAKIPDVRVLTVKDYYSTKKATDYQAYHLSCTVSGVPAEVRLMDESSHKAECANAPHGLYKSCGVLTMKLVSVFQDYL